MYASEDYQPRYNPAFLNRVREKQRLDRIEATRKAAAEKVRREREARERLAQELERQRREREQAEQNAKAVGMYRVIECIRRQDRPNVKDIIRLVAAEHGFTYDEVIGPRRQRELVAARFEAIHRVKSMRPDMSLPQLGRAFGGRDHTSILNAIRVYEKRLANLTQQAA